MKISLQRNTRAGHEESADNEVRQILPRIALYCLEPDMILNTSAMYDEKTTRIYIGSSAFKSK